MLDILPVILDSSMEYVYLFESVQVTLNVFNVNGHCYNADEPI